MQSDSDMANPEMYFISLITRRINLSDEARGAVRVGDGRSKEAIRADREAVEAELADMGSLVIR